MTILFDELVLGATAPARNYCRPDIQCRLQLLFFGQGNFKGSARAANREIRSPAMRCGEGCTLHFGLTGSSRTPSCSCKARKGTATNGAKWRGRGERPDPVYTGGAEAHRFF